MKLADQLREARKTARLSTTALAKEIGVSQSLVSGVENELHGTRIEVLERWADRCGYSVTLTPKTELPGEGRLSDEESALVHRFAFMVSSMDPGVRTTIDAMLTALELQRQTSK